jgi:hypothetical protein
MRSSFPTEFDGLFLGRSREAGGFDTPDGRVEYSEAYELSFESSDGLVQTCRVPVKQFDEGADFDVAKLPRYTQLHVIGDVHVRDNGGFLSLTQVRVMQAAKAA